jgi:hypothetical protein
MRKFLPNIILTAFTGTGSDQIDFSLNDVQYNFGATDVGNRLFTNLVGGTTYTMEFSSPVGQKESSYTLDVLQKDLVLPTFDANNDISFVSTAQNNVAGRIEFGLNAGDMLRVLTVSNLVGTISFELVGSPYSYSGAVPANGENMLGTTPIMPKVDTSYVLTLTTDSATQVSVQLDGTKVVDYQLQIQPPILPITSGLIGHYVVDGNTTATSWKDTTGRNSVTISGSLDLVTKDNYAIKTNNPTPDSDIPRFPYLKGTTSSSITWPSTFDIGNTENTDWTVINVTRYDPSADSLITKRRIMGRTNGWYMGHWSNQLYLYNAGVAAYGAPLEPFYNPSWKDTHKFANGDVWVFGISRPHKYTASYYPFDVPSSTDRFLTDDGWSVITGGSDPTSDNCKLKINNGGETSEFNVAEIIGYNRELTDEQVGQMKTYLVNRYSTEQEEQFIGTIVPFTTNDIVFENSIYDGDSDPIQFVIPANEFVPAILLDVFLPTASGLSINYTLDSTDANVSLSGTFTDAHIDTAVFTDLLAGTYDLSLSVANTQTTPVAYKLSATKKAITSLTLTADVLSSTGSLKQFEDDRFTFDLTDGDLLRQLFAKNTTDTATISYSITGSDNYSKSGSFVNASINILGLSPLVPSTADVSYGLRLYTTSTTNVSYEFSGTRIADYTNSADATNIAFAANQFTLENSLPTNDSDYFLFTIPAGEFLHSMIIDLYMPDANTATQVNYTLVKTSDGVTIIDSSFALTNSGETILTDIREGQYYLDFAPPTSQTETVTYKVTASKKALGSASFGEGTTLTIGGSVVLYNNDIFVFDVSGGYAVNTMNVDSFTGTGIVSYEITNVTDNTMTPITGTFNSSGTNILAGSALINAVDTQYNITLSTVSTTAITYSITGFREIDYDATTGTQLSFSVDTKTLVIQNKITNGDVDKVLFTVDANTFVPNINVTAFTTDITYTSEIIEYELSKSGTVVTSSTFSPTNIGGVPIAQNLLEGNYSIVFTVPSAQTTVVDFQLNTSLEDIKTPVFDGNNNMEISGNVELYNDDRAIITVSAGYSLNTIDVSAISAATDITFVLYDATGITQLHTSTFNSSGTNIIQGYPLIPLVDTSYVMTLKTASQTPLTYSLAATQTDDYAATGETLVFTAPSQIIDIYVSGGDFTSPYYNFYTDSAGTTQLEPSATLDLANQYRFYRLNGATSHAFYISDAGYKQPATAEITLTGSGSATTGITGTSMFTLEFTSNFTTSDTLTYYCTTHSSMVNTFNLVDSRNTETIQIQNTIIDGDIDKVSFTVADGYFMPYMMLSEFTGSGGEYINYSLVGPNTNITGAQFDDSKKNTAIVNTLLEGLYTLTLTAPVAQPERSYTLDLLEKPIATFAFNASNELVISGDITLYRADRITFELIAGDMMRNLTVSNNLNTTITYELTGTDGYTSSGTMSASGNNILTSTVLPKVDTTYTLMLSTQEPSTIAYELTGSKVVDYTTTAVAFDNNTITFDNSIYDGDTDAVTFTVPADEFIHSLMLNILTPNATINYNLQGASTASGSYSAADTSTAILTNIRTGSYTLTFTTESTTAVEYRLTGTKKPVATASFNDTANIFFHDSVTRYTDDIYRFDLSAGYALSVIQGLENDIAIPADINYTIVDAAKTITPITGTVPIGVYNDFNMLAGNVLIPTVDTAYELILSTDSTEPITYSFIGIRDLDYDPTTGTTIAFVNNALTIKNKIIDGDVDKVLFTVDANKYVQNIKLSAFTSAYYRNC